MKQDLTIEEIVWRYNVLNRHLCSSIEDNASEYEDNDDVEFKDIHVCEQICASIMYLHRIGAVKLHLNPEGSLTTGILFSCTKDTFIANANNIDENDVWVKSPSGRDISIPNLFSEEDDDNATIAVVFDFPDHDLGNFCAKIIHLLRQWCKNDIDVINMVIFMNSYFTEDFTPYSRCIWSIYLGLFEVDFWENRIQMPWEIQSIIENVLRSRNGNIGNVYDPFMRTGMNWILSENGKKYYADAQDMFHYYSIKMLCGICGADWENIKYKDCIEDWNPMDCDAIVATPELNKFVNISEGTKISIGEWLLNKMLTSFGDTKRQALLVLPSNVLYSGGEYEKLRHDLTEKNLLDMVITLPPDVFPGTGAASTIILLSNEREYDETIWMVDLAAAPMKHEDEEDDDSRLVVDENFAFKVFKEQLPEYFKMVYPDDIKQQEYNWYATSYIKKNADIPNGYKRISFCDILEEIEQYDIVPLVKYTIIEEDDLKDDPFIPNILKKVKDHKDFKSNKDEITKLQRILNASRNGDNVDWTSPEYHVDYSYYSNSDVLVLQFNGKMLTAWYQHEPMSSLRIDDGYYYYKVNKDEIDNNYLRLLLANATRDFHESMSNGDTICLDDVLKMEVTIPMSVEEQQKLYEQAKLNHLVEKARKEGLDEAINRMKEEYISEVRMRKHDMNPFISQLINLPENVEMYLDEIEGNEELVTAIREKMDVLLNTVIDLREHLNRLTEEEIYGEPEIVNILSFLKQYVGVFSNYSIELQVDSVAIEDSKANEGLVSINPIDLSTLISTIVENAIQHGFIKKDISYHMLINVSVDKDTDCYIIDLKNDGEPMPLGITKYIYGLRGEKSANSKGSGLGGYRVKSIVRHYGGDYDVICRRNLQTSTTTIRVLLPIYRSK